ncbi:hypothetical protein BBJ28_00003610 [Nothophytophthora sp. Chile5]|nr:hypothetical protein BBJ28_00003610 [Nothophytophthora sp. Chile5]
MTLPPRQPLTLASFFSVRQGNRNQGDTSGGGNNGGGVQGDGIVQGAEGGEMARLVATSSYQLDIMLTVSDCYQEWIARILVALFAMRMSEMALVQREGDGPPRRFDRERTNGDLWVMWKALENEFCSGNGLETTFIFNDVYGRKLKRGEPVRAYIDDLLCMRRPSLRLEFKVAYGFCQAWRNKTTAGPTVKENLALGVEKMSHVSTQDTMKLLHNRLNHAGKEDIKCMAKELSFGLNVNATKLAAYDSVPCRMATFRRMHYSCDLRQSTRPLEKLAVKMVTFSGEAMFLLLVDEVSRFKWAYLLS